MISKVKRYVCENTGHVIEVREPVEGTLEAVDGCVHCRDALVIGLATCPDHRPRTTYHAAVENVQLGQTAEGKTAVGRVRFQIEAGSIIGAFAMLEETAKARVNDARADFARKHGAGALYDPRKN